MARVPRRRADQLGDFVTVLELRAVDLEYGARIVSQGFGGCLKDSCFARTRGSEEQKVSNRASGGDQPTQVRLIDTDNLLDCFVLTDDERTELRFERFASEPVRIGSNITLISCMAAPLFTARSGGRAPRSLIPSHL
jgi:hypothetical protein